MTKEELVLMGKIVVACKGVYGIQAGMIPEMTNEFFRLADELDAAMKTVKDANTPATGKE